MSMPGVIGLTQELVRMNTINPPGNEAPAARFIGEILLRHGFEVEYVTYGENRLHLIASKGCSAVADPVLFTGHFDTVPLGGVHWNTDPFGGKIGNGKIYGRGTSDMKGGLAAMVVAAIEAFSQGDPEGGVILLFTAGEETGCQGAQHLMEHYQGPAKVKGIVVGEPTANIPAVGHKGGLYLNLSATGISAHSSMPQLGVNAIYKVARAILKAESFDFRTGRDPLLGYPTLNVGKVHGGVNLNSVPDHAGFTIDVRSTSLVDHRELLGRFREEFGEEIAIETLVDLKAVTTSESDPFVQQVYNACGIRNGAEGFPVSLPYLTDGAVLQHAFHGAPTVILGPGQPEMAHQTDEFCLVEKLERAVKIYKGIILNNDEFKI